MWLNAVYRRIEWTHAKTRDYRPGRMHASLSAALGTALTSPRLPVTVLR